MLRAEPSAERVARLIKEQETLASSINMGEVLYRMVRVLGERRARAAIDSVRAVVRTEDPDWPLVREAARLKAAGNISYADCFAVATARRHHAPLYTGNPEIVALADTVNVVDLRPTP